MIQRSIVSKFSLLAAILLLSTIESEGIEGVFANDEISAINKKLLEKQADPGTKRLVEQSAKLLANRLEFHGDKLLWQRGPAVSAMSVVTEGKYLLATENRQDGTQMYFPIYIKDDDTLYTNGMKFVRVKK